MIEFKGRCMGVRIKPRGTGDDPDHAVVALLVEDDENWIEKDYVDSYWLDELIQVLQAARKQAKRTLKAVKYGYDFPKVSASFSGSVNGKRT